MFFLQSPSAVEEKFESHKMVWAFESGWNLSSSYCKILINKPACTGPKDIFGCFEGFKYWMEFISKWVVPQLKTTIPISPWAYMCIFRGLTIRRLFTIGGGLFLGTRAYYLSFTVFTLKCCFDLLLIHLPKGIFLYQTIWFSHFVLPYSQKAFK